MKQNMKRGVDYIGVGVGALIVEREGRTFLSRRGPQAKNERGLWEFPGGSVEFGETLAAALQREMREEYGIEIAVGELLDVVDHILPAEGQHWVSPTFICTIVSGKPVIREPGKCSEIGWFFPDGMPAGLTSITRQNLAHYLNRLERKGSLLKTGRLENLSTDLANSTE
jgi:mutator protein MutT